VVSKDSTALDHIMSRARASQWPARLASSCIEADRTLTEGPTMRRASRVACIDDPALLRRREFQRQRPRTQRDTRNAAALQALIPSKDFCQPVGRSALAKAIAFPRGLDGQHEAGASFGCVSDRRLTPIRETDCTRSWQAGSLTCRSANRFGLSVTVGSAMSLIEQYRQVPLVG
jgi:hypothetical protein